MVEVLHYLSPGGEDTFDAWFSSLKDDATAARVAARIARLAAGNYGDCKPVGQGVWEMRIDVGPGYRVYYARTATTCVLLLGGGDKSTQPADIRQSIARWRDYKERTNTK